MLKHVILLLAACTVVYVLCDLQHTRCLQTSPAASHAQGGGYMHPAHGTSPEIEALKQRRALLNRRLQHLWEDSSTRDSRRKLDRVVLRDNSRGMQVYGAELQRVCVELADAGVK